MGPHGKSLCIEVRRASRPIALAQAVLRGEPVSNRLFRSAALAEHVGALLALGTVTHIVGFSGQMAQYLPEHFAGPRSEERRVGTGCGSTGSLGWSADN